MIKQAMMAAAAVGMTVPADAETKFDETSVTLKDLTNVFLKNGGQEILTTNYRIVIGNPTEDLTKADLSVIGQGFANEIESQSIGKPVLEDLPEEFSFLNKSDKLDYSSGGSILAAGYGYRYQFSDSHQKAVACYAGHAGKYNTPEMEKNPEVKYKSGNGQFTVCIAYSHS